MKNVSVRKDHDVKASEWMDAVVQVIGGNIVESTQSNAKVHPASTCAKLETCSEPRAAQAVCAATDGGFSLPSGKRLGHVSLRIAPLPCLAQQHRDGGNRVTARAAAGGGGGVRGGGGERGVAARTRAVPAQGPGRRGR